MIKHCPYNKGFVLLPPGPSLAVAFSSQNDYIVSQGYESAMNLGHRTLNINLFWYIKLIVYNIEV